MGGSDAGAFVDLRRLADWLASSQRVSVERVVRRLGVTCVPLLCRELISADAKRRQGARTALSQAAQGTSVRPRVVAELRKIVGGDAPHVCDEAKVLALALLAECGERQSARFNDPSGIQRRSALALATELDNPTDVAAAVDMMVKQMATEDMVQLLEVMVGASAGAAYHLAMELCARLDVDADTRERIATIALGTNVPLPVTERRIPRPTQTSVLAHADGRVVIVASRKILGERRWRRWAVLVDAQGAIAECLHEDASALDADHGELTRKLVADGYAIVSTDLDRARGLVTAAARHSASASDAPERLPGAYYLGRDLLDLGEAHLGGRVHAHPTTTTLGRAVELIVDNDVARAQVLLARCSETSPDAAAATAACLIAQGRFADAVAPLVRAIALEPDFALHHWNHAAVLHQLGDASGCHAALRRFLTTSERTTGLFADPDQPSRVAMASRLIADLERSARLAGATLASAPRRRKRATKRGRATSSSATSST